MTIADSLEITLQTKNGLKSVIEDNGKTAPTKFSEYPKTFDNIIDTLREQIKITDRIVINADTTLEQLDNFFEYVPNVPSGSSTTTQDTAKVIAANLNVRADGNGSANYLGVLVQGDIVNVYGTASSGWYKINQWRENGASSSLVTHDTYAYITNNTAYVTYDAGKTTTTVSRKIDVSKMVGTEQLLVDYKLAEIKGWEVIFDPNFDPTNHDTSGGDTSGGGGSGGGESGSGSSGSASSTVEQTVTYSFDNCYTDNYSTQSYATKVSTASNTIRQGHWQGWYYYKGNIRFSSSKLTEIKNILNNTNVSKVELYLERANTNNGLNAASYMSVYLCDSKGTNSDVVVNNTSTLKRGASVWLTLSTSTINALKKGTHDHFKTYASSDQSHYIVYVTNPKLRITYTAK